MALKAHLDSPTEKSDHRRQSRRALKLETSGAVGSGAEANVTVHNISAAGLLIESNLPLGVGEMLSIDMPQIGPVGAEIVWQSERLFGCAFEQALGEAALAAAQLRGEPANLPATTPSDPRPRSGALGGTTLGTKINRLRRERSLTLAQVADALGVSKPTVWAWEKGKAQPIPERIEAIAQVLGVASDELSENSLNGNAAALVQDCRRNIANAYGIDEQNVRIMIEV